MAAFPTLQLQQETNRKILEDLQLKKQLLLQKGGSITAINQAIGQMPMPSALVQPLDFGQSTSNTTPLAQRGVFNPAAIPATLGFFIQQDSFYGNTFIPVLPRFDSAPVQVHHPTK